MKEKIKLYFIIILILPILTIFPQGANTFFKNHNIIKQKLGSVYSDSQLFSFYDFVNKTNLLKSGSFESVELDSVVLISASGNRSKYSYYYNSQNRTKSFYIDFFQNNKWEQGWRIIYSYDLNGKLIKMVDATCDNSKWINFSRETYLYNSKGKIEQIIIALWLNKYWLNRFKETYFYDFYGNNTTILGQKFNGVNLVNNQKITFTYELNGLANSMLFQNWAAENWQNNIFVKYGYDKKGNRILAVNQKWNNTEWVNNFKAKVKYNSNGDIIYSLLDIWDSTKWRNFQRFFLNYDTNNKFISGSYEYLINHMWVSGDGTLFFYAPNGFFIGVISAKLFAYYKSITAVKENMVEFNNRFNLAQNYPNPFNPTTNISFELSKSEIVTLKVFNTLGKEVKILINNEQKTAGKYTIQFNGENLTSGLYIYKIQFGNFTIAKKMILMK